MLARWIVLAVLFPLVVPSAARAGCCRLVRIDSAVQATVRACEPDADDGCASVVFEGALPQGASTWLCVGAPTIVYQEIDPAGGYKAPVGAACTANADVEL